MHMSFRPPFQRSPPETQQIPEDMRETIFRNASKTSTFPSAPWSFETRQESYFWLLDALELYRPKLYEFARLNISPTKRQFHRGGKAGTLGEVRSQCIPTKSNDRVVTHQGYPS